MNNMTFHQSVTSFFTHYLAMERGVSSNTIRSYARAVTSLVDYLLKIKNIKASAISLNHITRETVTGCLDWLQDTCAITDTTRNQRLAAYKSYARYMQHTDVTRLSQWQEILSIKQKRTATATVKYLSIEQISALLSCIPSDTAEDRRDLVMLTLLYETGARAQEIVDLTSSELRLDGYPYVILTGKGNKSRMVPLRKEMVTLLENYLSSLETEQFKYRKRPLFQNRMGGSLTTCGITYILQKYARIAANNTETNIDAKITPHCLRHSRAMHWLQSGINLVYIRDLLGHVSIKTTEIYARADSQKKREAIENAYGPTLNNEGLTSWERDPDLKVWLKSLAGNYQK